MRSTILALTLAGLASFPVFTQAPHRNPAFQEQLGLKLEPQDLTRFR
jgi:hypothetical protein